MKVRLLEIGRLPKGLSHWIQARLPYPFVTGDVVSLRLDLSGCRDIHRNQLDARCLLDRLPQPAADQLLMALVPDDLFFSVMTYVFGLTELGLRRGVLSCHRLGDELAGREGVLRQRALVEVVHELGHAVGLVHCPVNECAMHRTLWPEGIDTKQAELCPSCLATLTNNGYGPPAV